MEDKNVYKILNPKEKDVYNYVKRNREKVTYMNVRELAESCNVSTTTILRFVKKIGLHSYKEFKYWCMKNNDERSFDYYTQEIIDCLIGISSPMFNEKLDEAVDLIKESNFVLFGGIGNSGGTALLGARYFSNFGIFSLTINDPFYNLEALPNNMIVIVLSASGETPETINECNRFINLRIPLICITSNENSTLGEMADLTLAYNLSEKRKDGSFDMASQIPALHIIELLANRIKK